MKLLNKLLFAVSLTLAIPAWAADPIIIVVDAENPPFMFAQGGKATGIYPALLTAAFARIDRPLRLEAKPWKRALEELDQGKAGVAGIYKNPERAAKYDFSDPILSENMAVYFNKDKPIDFKTVADLYGKRVGVMRGWVYDEAFEAGRKSGRIVTEEVGNDQANFLKLEAGRLDAILAIEETGKLMLATGKFGHVTQSSAFLSVNKSYLAFKKNSGQNELLTNFNKTLAEMRKNGSFDELVRKALSK